MLGGRAIALLAVAVVCAALPATALADRAFAPRFAQNAQGDIAIAANSLESCLDALTVCGNVRDAVGGAISGNNNNERTMTWVDVDGDPATFDSSSASLTLPPGATVLFAGLYYGGRLAAGTGGSPPPSPGARNTVLFKAPGDTGYRTLTASQVDDASTQYQGFVNVTPIVGAAGAGTYTTANVQLGTGRSDSSSGGWALVVAYGDPAAPSRNLSVFDGMQTVGGSSTVTIPLSGFQTPLTGPVASTVGVVAYEGDLGTPGDGAAIQGGSGAFTALSNAVNPGPPATSASNSNVFNSTISNAGALVTAPARAPGFQNNLGYDADLFRTTNVLANAQTSTQVRLSTSGDAYQPGVVTLATDLYAPRITATKTVDAASANLGDTLTYTVTLQNTGQDGAVGTTFTDVLPAGTAFVPGSIRLNGAPLSDVAGDDLGELAGDRVVVRLGAGATAGAGGTLAPSASATVSFQARVAAAGLPSGSTIENTADLSFQAATTGVASTVTTAPATTRVLVPDLAIGKTHAPDLAPGLTSTYTITVGNVGEGPTSGLVTVTDTLESGLTLTGAATGAGWTCSPPGATITCTRPDALAAGSDYPPISIPVLVSSGAPPGLSNTATVAAASDGNPDNNSFTDAGAVSEPAIDLHVEKAVTSTPDFTPAGYLFFLDPVTYRIEVTNNGIGDAADVQLTEILDAPLIVESITPSQGSCSATDCNLGTITPGQAPVTIDVQARAGTGFEDYPSAALLNNTATVSAPVGREINPDDNSASAVIPTVPWAETSITKAFAPAQPLAGGPVTYTLTVHSDGPGTVDMVVADILPEALLKPPTSISISGGTGVCQYDPTGESLGVPPPGFPIVGCEIPQLGPGEDRVITIEGTLAPESAGTEVTNVGLSSNTLPLAGAFSFEPDFSNNDDSVTFTPGSVDLQVTKERVGGTGPVAVGDVVEFLVTVVNAGTAEAPATTISDTLPDGLVPVDVEPGCSAAGQTITCGPFPLGAQTGVPVTVRARVTPAAAERTLTNTATATTSAPDVSPANNAASADVTVGPYSTLTVSKTADSPTVVAGSTASFTATVRNEGPSVAGGVSLTDVLPDGLTLRSATPSQGTCAGAACDLGGLAAGATAQVRIVADVAPSIAGRRVNAVEVAAATPSAPARAEAPFEIGPPGAAAAPPRDVDLAVDVRAPARATEGAAGTWTLEVVNNGPGTATGVTLTGATSRAADLAGAREAQTGCTARLPISCGLGTLAAGERRTVSLGLRPRFLGLLRLTGTVRAAETETTQANNVDRASLQIAAGRARVTLTKRAHAAAVRAGGRVGFTITVRNRGRVTARSLEVCDRLPALMAFTRTSGARLSEDRACWTIASLPAGASRTYRVTARALASSETVTAVNAATLRGANTARATARARVRLLQQGAAAPIVTG